MGLLYLVIPFIYDINLDLPIISQLLHEKPSAIYNLSHNEIGNIENVHVEK